LRIDRDRGLETFSPAQVWIMVSKRAIHGASNCARPEEVDKRTLKSKYLALSMEKQRNFRPKLGL
jgi:hypothetical protein